VQSCSDHLAEGGPIRQAQIDRFVLTRPSYISSSLSGESGTEAKLTSLQSIPYLSNSISRLRGFGKNSLRNIRVGIGPMTLRSILWANRRCCSLERTDKPSTPCRWMFFGSLIDAVVVGGTLRCACTCSQCGTGVRRVGEGRFGVARLRVRLLSLVAKTPRSTGNALKERLEGFLVNDTIVCA
jgi:hypothetical protein